MILRPAEAEDVSAVRALEHALFGVDAWSEAAVRTELTGPDRFAVVEVEADAVVGYAALAPAGDVADLTRIAVHPAHRRRGVAARLLAALVEEACERGAGRMLLEVSEANEAARAFYARQEFTEISLRRRYYRDGSDALVLERHLR